MGRALAVLLLVSCIDPTVQRCGDLICPPSAVCLDGMRCVAQGAIDQCAQLASGAACTVDNVYGRCTDDGALMVCEPATCGDGVIDAPLREVCDGSAAFSAQCVDLGYDLGMPACTSDCAFDASSCVRFGWDLVVDAPVSKLWTDGTIMAYVRSDPDSLEIHGGAFDISEPGAPVAVFGGGGHVFVAYPDSIAEASGTMVTAIATPFLISVAQFAADDAGALYALVDCSVWKYTGTWDLLIDATGFCGAIVTGPGQRVFVIAYGDLVDELVNHAYVQYQRADGPIRAIRFVAGGAYVASALSFTYWSDAGGVRKLADGDFRSVAAAGPHAYATLVDGTALRYDGAQIDAFTPPTTPLVDDGHGGLYSFSGPIYRFSGMMFGDLVPLPTPAGERVVASLRLLDDEVVAASTLSLYARTGAAAWTESFYFGASVDAIAGIANDELAALTHEAVGPQYLWRKHGTNPWNIDASAPTTAKLSGLWMAADQTLYIVGATASAGYIAWQDPVLYTWTELVEDGCDFRAIDGGVIAGACGGVASVWRLDVGTWSELHRAPELAGPLSAVRALPSGAVFAIGDGGVVWLDGGTWHVDTTVHGSAISGDDGDVWVSGSLTPIEHWDGHTWSKMTTRSLGEIAIAASPHRVVMPGAARGHVVLLR